MHSEHANGVLKERLVYQKTTSQKRDVSLTLTHQPVLLLQTSLEKLVRLKAPLTMFPANTVLVKESVFQQTPQKMTFQNSVIAELMMKEYVVSLMDVIGVKTHVSSKKTLQKSAWIHLAQNYLVINVQENAPFVKLMVDVTLNHANLNIAIAKRLRTKEFAKASEMVSSEVLAVGAKTTQTLTRDNVFAVLNVTQDKALLVQEIWKKTNAKLAFHQELGVSVLT
mmetsp:Transcript_23600/g.26176  ORF Transcript_23600/g.26176 Transcript_23600/m.26176 type:complete len:224 (-) Transcript_23600:788-1459(-)